MVYLYYISCLRYTILVGNPWNLHWNVLLSHYQDWQDIVWVNSHVWMLKGQFGVLWPCDTEWGLQISEEERESVNLLDKQKANVLTRVQKQLKLQEYFYLCCIFFFFFFFLWMNKLRITMILRCCHSNAVEIVLHVFTESFIVHHTSTCRQTYSVTYMYTRSQTSILKWSWVVQVCFVCTWTLTSLMCASHTVTHSHVSSVFDVSRCATLYVLFILSVAVISFLCMRICSHYICVCVWFDRWSRLTCVTWSSSLRWLAALWVSTTARPSTRWKSRCVEWEAKMVFHCPDQPVLAHRGSRLVYFVLRPVCRLVRLSFSVQFFHSWVSVFSCFWGFSVTK